MASFVMSAKMEALSETIQNDCCAMAFLSAIIKCSGNLNLTNGKRYIEITTEIVALYPKINEILKQYYGCEANFEEVKDEISTKQKHYKIIIPYSASDRLLEDLGLTEILADGTISFYNGIMPFIIESDCCKRSYVRGAFLACATSNIVIKNYSNSLNQKNTSGYHLEFVFNFEKLAEDFVELLKFFEIPAKITIRKNSPIVYLKEYQLICDALALVGANKAVLLLQNEAAIRDVRNNVNRQVNCFNANLNKTVNAAVKQLEAIKTIQNTIGIENLSAGLYELCLIRLANPEENLENLTKLYSENISKSGINHRFKKLEKIAEQLKKNQ